MGAGKYKLIMKYFKKNLLSFFLVILILFGLQSWTVADDIRDFQIERMSIGDSLLDHFSETKIKNSIKKGMFERIKDETFTLTEIEDNNFDNYERIQFIFKKLDKKYIIFGMHGVLWIRNDMNKCMKKMNEISLVINNTINYTDNYEFENEEMYNLGVYSGNVYKLKDGYISIHCYDWNNKTETEKNWVDNLRVNIKTNEYEDFLNKD